MQNIDLFQIYKEIKFHIPTFYQICRLQLSKDIKILGLFSK